jgi:hypothetical protein
MWFASEVKIYTVFSSQFHTVMSNQRDSVNFYGMHRKLYLYITEGKSVAGYIVFMNST